MYIYCIGTHTILTNSPNILANRALTPVHTPSAPVFLAPPYPRATTCSNCLAAGTGLCVRIYDDRLAESPTPTPPPTFPGEAISAPPQHTCLHRPCALHKSPSLLSVATQQGSRVVDGRGHPCFLSIHACMRIKSYAHILLFHPEEGPSFNYTT